MYMPQTYTPDWNHWFYNEMNPTRMYSLIKRSLQALNWLQGLDKRWVLKTPHHLGFLPALNREFPDAHLIVTHRDPASSNGFQRDNERLRTPRKRTKTPDPRHGFEVAIHMADGMIGGLLRDIDHIDMASVTHVHFHDYMADVMGTLGSIYKAIDLPLTDQARNELTAYIDAHPRGRPRGSAHLQSREGFRRDS